MMYFVLHIVINGKKENVVCHTLGPVTYLIVAIITHTRILYARICILYMFIYIYIYLGRLVI